MNDVRKRGVFVRWILPPLALVLIALATAYFSLAPKPVVEQANAYRSPDDQWQATLERVDNGMGMGLGTEYYEVHVHQTGSRIRSHGDAERSVAFYLNSENVSPPQLRWIGDRRLVIHYFQNAPYQPGKKLERVDEIAIEYQREPP